MRLTIRLAIAKSRPVSPRPSTRLGLVESIEHLRQLVRRDALAAVRHAQSSAGPLPRKRDSHFLGWGGEFHRVVEQNCQALTKTRSVAAASTAREPYDACAMPSAKRAKRAAAIRARTDARGSPRAFELRILIDNRFRIFTKWRFGAPRLDAFSQMFARSGITPSADASHGWRARFATRVDAGARSPRASPCLPRQIGTFLRIYSILCLNHI